MSKDAELETVDMTHNVIMGEALERLRINPDFITVIEEGYLKQKVLSSVSLLAVPQIKKSGERPEVMEDLVSASNLSYYFKTIEHFYDATKNPILSDEEEAELEAQEEAE